MNIEIKEKSDNNLVMIIENSASSLVNGLRRTILAHVPTMTIEDVWIVENSSSLYDKIIAQRLGFIPLTTDLESFVFPEKCECDGAGCSLCQVTFTINKEAINEDSKIYSRDLKSEDPKVVPVSDEILIVELFKGQKIVLEAYAKLGIGKIHAKSQPVSTVSYKYMPNILIDTEKCTKCENCIQKCPKEIVVKNDKEITISDIMECSLCRECEKACEEGAIKVEWDDTTFILYVESTGSLPLEKICLTACDLYKKKVTDLLEALEIKV